MPKILAIDDKKDNLVILATLLKNLMPECTVITALSGIEGIEKARTESPDAILLDVKMPGMDGFETCRRLKSDESTKHIPVIMITAIKTDPQSRVKGLETGADAFLSKPIEENELASQVKVVLRIKKAEDALREERDSLEKRVMERTAALGESEEKFRNYIRRAPDGVFIVDDAGQYVEVNKSACQIMGYSKEELKKMSIRDLLDKESLKDGLAHFKKLLKTGAAVSDLWHKRKDGLKRCLTVNAVKLSEKRFLGFCKDITDRKKAEQRVKERIKELEILYSLDKIAGKKGFTLDKLYQELVGILPQGCQYPEIACTRIVIGDSEFRTNNFAESAWMQSAPVKVSGTVVGKIEVGYLEEMPKEDEGPFLKEEKLLIDSIAERLGQITERKLAEEKIKASLHEKEVLLRELHHRTRNNMQLICSLLSLKSASDNNEHVKSVLMEMENRIKSMALVHQKLNKSADFSHVHLDEYINDLVPLLMQSYRMSSDRITTTIDVDEAVVVSIDMAIPCGLIFNELIANSLQHAFPGDRKGEICIGLKKDEDGMIELAVSDNGIGVPPDFDFMSSATLGLTTIFGLGSQLDGEVIFEREIGLSCRVRFYNKPFRTMV